MFRQASENRRYLRRSLSLAKYHLGHANTQGAMVIDFGKAQILEGKVAQAGNGVVRCQFATADLLKKFADGIRVQASFSPCAFKVALI